MEHTIKQYENKTLFSNSICAASETLEMDEVYIEKDYWITEFENVET